jgi:hypothetical protein
MRVHVRGVSEEQGKQRTHSNRKLRKSTRIQSSQDDSERTQIDKWSTYEENKTDGIPCPALGV